MGTEIERKFLVDGDKFLSTNGGASGVVFHQGYLSRKPSVRVRVVPSGNAWLTIKGEGDVTRAEFEYEIPLTDAYELLAMCKSKLLKIRFTVTSGTDTWEVDQMMGDLRGLWLGEINLSDPGQAFERPEWVKEEVTYDPRYTNASLAENGLPVS